MTYLIAFAFIVVDYITGILKAFATKTFASRIMREGLFHKVALLLVMLLGWLVDFGQRFVDLGISIPVGAAVCVYIIMMELGSALENVCKINPELMPGKLAELFSGRNNTPLLTDGPDTEAVAEQVVEKLKSEAFSALFREDYSKKEDENNGRSR